MARPSKAGIAVAGFLGVDSDTIEDECRYQPTRTPCPLYDMGDAGYLTATKGKKPPRTDWSGYQGWFCDRWVHEGVDQFTGWNIWRAVDDD